MALRREAFLFAVLLPLAALVAWPPGSVVADDDPAGRPAVGDEAPPITATTWLNTEGGRNPTEDAEDRAILVELWGTWCGPCVRSMPKLQSLWERYRDRGLLVVAITRESADEVRGFLEEHGYTMPVGCDPTQACVRRYQPAGWPSTYLVSKNGEIAYVGGPYAVEPAVEKALGLESSAPTLLTQYLESLAKGDAGTIRVAIERLLEKAPARFDAKAWAQGVLGDAPEVEGKPRRVRPPKLLDRLCKAYRSSKSDDRTAVLTQLATGEAEPMDLRAWVVGHFAKAFPLKRKELDDLLRKKRYEPVLDMLLDRGPSSPVRKAAARHEGLAAFCAKKLDDTRTLARKGLMALTYLFGEKRYDPEKNDEFWRDISVSGMMTNKERNQLVGILIGGEPVTAENAEGYVARKLDLWALMRSLAAGEAPRARGVAKEAAAERKRILRALAARYG